MPRIVCLGLVVWFAGPGIAHGQTVLTFEETIRQAREQAGAVAVARARIAEAEAALVEASPRFNANPVVDGAVGPRVSGRNRFTEIDLSISQQFETGGQRRARLTGARAAIARQQAGVDHAASDAAQTAAAAFLDGLAAAERIRLDASAAAVAQDLREATERRYAAGDIAASGVNLVRIDAARAAAALAGSRADLSAIEGRLRAVLQLPPAEPIELRGTLDPSPMPPFDDLAAAVDRRPELRMLTADAEEADADASLGRAMTRPNLGVRAQYGRESTDTILVGGLTLTLPVFQKGQGLFAAGTARASRARLERDIARQTVLADLRTAYDVYQQRQRLAEALAQDVTPSAADNDDLGRRSYEAGEMNLIELLLLRRDSLEARRAIVDRRLAAAHSRLDVQFAAGVLP